MSSVANVVDGVLEAESTPTYANAKSYGTDALGKDAFMTLLVTQMQNQDPLNPSSDTEFISQLAQFSSLEQMENLNSTLTNQNAFSMVGKNVIINVGASSGNVTDTVAGYVQYVEIKDGKAYLAVNEQTYSIDDLYTVIDDDYLASVLDSVDKEENKETVNDSDVDTDVEEDVDTETDNKTE